MPCFTVICHGELGHGNSSKPCLHGTGIIFLWKNRRKVVAAGEAISLRFSSVLPADIAL